jgi:hypothetical protein
MLQDYGHRKIIASITYFVDILELHLLAECAMQPLIIYPIAIGATNT